ncbi:hypothetical protein KC963_03685 [Candidatus Saccharibacteria bacterium]|nr:hypothetical protein [Candidatus Saccharibacteria bacterium]
MTKDLYYYNLLTQREQFAAMEACSPIRRGSRRRKLTAKEARQLPIDLERWAERQIKRRTQAKQWLHPEWIERRKFAMESAAVVEEMARKTAGTALSFHALTFKILRERHPQKYRPIMILLGVDAPQIVTVN